MACIGHHTGQRRRAAPRRGGGWVRLEQRLLHLTWDRSLPGVVSQVAGGLLVVVLVRQGLLCELWWLQGLWHALVSEGAGGLEKRPLPGRAWEA